MTTQSRTLFRTRIKFCGMTRAGDIRLASELGADAIGMIFVTLEAGCWTANRAVSVASPALS